RRHRRLKEASTFIATGTPDVLAYLLPDATTLRLAACHVDTTSAQMPWAEYRVRLQLRVRKWFCRNRHCRRRIFTERLPTVATPWARRTLRLAQHLVDMGLALGGKAGVRLSQRW